MAFDWSKLTYSQLLALAQQQDPTIAAGYQKPGDWNDYGNAPGMGNTGAIDLSKLGIPGKAEVVASPYGGLQFNAYDPSGSGHRVAIKQGVGDSTAQTYYNPSDTFLDKAIPIMTALGGGAVMGGALLGAGSAAGGSSGAIGSGATSIPADISGELANSGLQTLNAADIAAAGGDIGSNAAIGAGSGFGTAGAGGALGGVSGGGAPELGSFVPGTGPIGSGTPSISGNIASELGNTPVSGLGASDIAAAGGGTFGSGSGMGSLLSGANEFLGSPLGKLGTTLLGGLIGSQPNQQTSNMTKQIDPRLAPYVYGPGGVLPNAGALYNNNPSGINDNMRQGWQTALNAVSNPATVAAYQKMLGVGSGLLSGPVAGNPFTTGQASVPSMPAQFRSLLGG